MFLVKIVRIGHCVAGTNLDNHAAVDFFFLFYTWRKVQTVVGSFGIRIRCDEHFVADENNCLSSFDFHSELP